MHTSNHDAVVPIDTTVEIACAYSLALLSTTASYIATSTQNYQVIVGGKS